MSRFASFRAFYRFHSFAGHRVMFPDVLRGRIRL